MTHSKNELKIILLEQLTIDQDERLTHFEIAQMEGKNSKFLSNILKVETRFVKNMLSYICTGWCEESISDILSELLLTYTAELNYFMFDHQGEINFEETQMINTPHMLKSTHQNDGAVLALADVSMSNYKHNQLLYKYALFINS